jgi:hypothetical protein
LGVACQQTAHDKGIGEIGADVAEYIAVELTKTRAGGGIDHATVHIGVALGGAPRFGQTTAPILGIELALRQVDYWRRSHELGVIAQQLHQ